MHTQFLGFVGVFFKAYFICQIFAHLIPTKSPKLGNIQNTKPPLYKV